MNTLCSQNRWGEAARRLAGLLDDDSFRSIEGRSKHELWLELCDIITKHPAEVAGEGLDVEAVLRGGIRKYKDEVRLHPLHPHAAYCTALPCKETALHCRARKLRCTAVQGNCT